MEREQIWADNIRKAVEQARSNHQMVFPISIEAWDELNNKLFCAEIDLESSTPYWDSVIVLQAGRDFKEGLVRFVTSDDRGVEDELTIHMSVPPLVTEPEAEPEPLVEHEPLSEGAAGAA
jgi:hypothetical protein